MCASGSFGKAKSLTEWLRDKRSNEYRQTNQPKKKKVDRNRREEGDELVTTNIGVIEYKGNQLKQVWGKRLPIKIQKWRLKESSGALNSSFLLE